MQHRRFVLPSSFSRLASFLVATWLPSVVYAQPLQDDGWYTAPVGVPSTLGGPTPRGEITILRERSFTTAPVVTGTGITLTPGDPDRDGVFAQSIFVRSGPVVDNTRNPETEGSIVFPAGVTVVGVSVTTAQITAGNATLGLAPGLNYTASSPGFEVSSTEYVTVTVNGDGTTTVSFRTNMNTSPYTDSFRVLIDYGMSFTPGVSMRVQVDVGDDVNVGRSDGGRTGVPATPYEVVVPLTLSCTEDADRDTIADCHEGPGDADGDGTPNYLDLDSDGDGFSDAEEAGDTSILTLPVDTDGDGTPDFLQPGGCLARGCLVELVCIPTGATQPGEPCRICDPTRSRTSYSVHVGAACDDGRFCTVSDACTGDGRCVGSPRICDDGVSCTADVCDESARSCVSTLDGRFCRIDSNCVAANERDPSNAACAACVPMTASDRYSYAPTAACDSDGDSLPDLDEGYDDTDGDGRADAFDDDDDGDGISTLLEVMDGSMHGNDVDGDGRPNWLDTDADGDGILDEVEGRGDVDGDGIPDYLDPIDDRVPDAGPRIDAGGSFDAGIANDAGGSFDANVEADAGRATDAGVSPLADAGFEHRDGSARNDGGDPAGADAGETPTLGGTAGGACGCRVTSQRTSARELALTLGLLLWASRRRQRHSRIPRRS